jgi:hypothetical protein
MSSWMENRSLKTNTVDINFVHLEEADTDIFELTLEAWIICGQPHKFTDMVAYNEFKTQIRHFLNINKLLTLREACLLSC